MSTNEEKEMMEEQTTDTNQQEPNRSEPTSSHAEPNQTEADAKIKLLESQLQTQKDQLLRTFAEFENYKKRNETEKANLITYGNESILKDLLPILDDFERSLSAFEKTTDIESIKTGVQMIFTNLTKVLDAKGVKKIECVGKKFDVNEHEALLHVDKEGTESDTVVEEVQKGYTLNGRVIRHSKVLVSK